ncbi:hypothetical protein FRX31_033727, partial [Thalictrum thalictroides]
MGKPCCYLVRKGVRPGIYLNWQDAKAQVEGFSGNDFQGCESIDQAQFLYAQYLSRNVVVPQQNIDSRGLPTIPPTLPPALPRTHAPTFPPMVAATPPVTVPHEGDSWWLVKNLVVLVLVLLIAVLLKLLFVLMSSEEECELVAAIVAILAVHFMVHRQRQSRRCRRAPTLPRAPYTYRDPDRLDVDPTNVWQPWVPTEAEDPQPIGEVIDNDNGDDGGGILITSDQAWTAWRDNLRDTMWADYGHPEAQALRGKEFPYYEQCYIIIGNETANGLAMDVGDVEEELGEGVQPYDIEDDVVYDGGVPISPTRKKSRVVSDEITDAEYNKGMMEAVRSMENHMAGPNIEDLADVLLKILGDENEDIILEAVEMLGKDKALLKMFMGLPNKLQRGTDEVWAEVDSLVPG